jgi:hypothetical protein
MDKQIYIQDVPSIELGGQTYTASDDSLIASFSTDITFNSSTDYVEYFVYNANKQIIDSVERLGTFAIYGEDLSISPEQDLESRAYTEGQYYTVYNFLRPLLSSSIVEPYYISEISTDRTEIRLASTSILGGDIVDSATALKAALLAAPFQRDFNLNFGQNNLIIANNLLLDETNPEDITILIKLYEPLPEQYAVQSTCWAVEKIAESKAYLINIQVSYTADSTAIQIKGPNLNLLQNSQSNKSTEYQTTNTLQETTDPNLKYQLNSILAETGIELNVDYTDYSNFVFFSSAQTRLENFYYKLGLIEQYTVSASYGTGNINYYNSGSISHWDNKINEVITNFDGYEYYLYFDSSSTAWPKLNSTPPYINVPTTSSIGINWLDGQLTTAETYDMNNKDGLVEAIPLYIKEDPDNANFELFVEMVGQHFDSIWVYTQAVTKKYNSDNRVESGLSKDLVGTALKDFGIKLYENNYTSDNLYNTYLGYTPSGSLLPNTGQELITTYVTASATGSLIPLDNLSSEIYKRLYHNLPYLLKKKGTVEGLNTLITTFGIPDTIIRVYEYGGKDKNTNTWDQQQRKYNYAFDTEGINYVTSSFVLNSNWNADNDRPGSVEFRFKTRGIPAEDHYSQSLWSTDTGINLILTYTGSNLISGSYTGSIATPYSKYGKLDLIPDYTAPQTSASIYLPFFNGGWWSVLINKQGTNLTLYAKNNLYQEQNGNTLGFQASASIDPLSATAWNTAVESYFGSSSFNAETFSGSLQELRYYTVALSESSFNDFVMNPASTEGNYTNAAPNQLAFRAALGGVLCTSSISIHPKVAGEQPATASFTATSTFYFNIPPSSASMYVDTGYVDGGYVEQILFTPYIPNVETTFYDQPAVGIKNAVTDKIKTGVTDVYGTVLSGLNTLQQNYAVSQSYTRDVNYLEVGFSPQNEINDDINSQIGYFNIGEYIGDPRQISDDNYKYPALDQLSTEYFKKYSSSYNYTDYLRLIKFFDNSLFKLIKDFIPARTAAATGAIIKQHLLERNRQRPAQVEYTQPEYTGSITSLARDYQTGSIEVFTGGTGGSVPTLPIGGIQTSFYSGSLFFATGGPNTYFHNLLINPTNEYYTYNISFDVPSGYTDGSLVIYDSNTIETSPTATNVVVSKSMADISGTTQNYTFIVRDGISISYFFTSINFLTITNLLVTHNIYDAAQNYPTQSVNTLKGIVSLPFSTAPYYTGDFVGSTVEVVSSTLQNNPLLGERYRVSIPDLQDINVQVSGTLRIDNFIYGTSSVPFNVDTLNSPKYNNTTYEYTPEFGNTVDFEVILQGTYTASQAGIPGTSSLVADIAVAGITGSSPKTLFTVAAGATSTFTGSFTQSLVFPTDSYLYPNTYKVVLYESSSNGSATLVDVTASFNNNTKWTVTTQNLAAQSTYYLDPTVYTQQNFPGNINNFSDYNSLLNNVYSNRVSNIYYDVNYSTDALNPINFQTIISQSTTYAQIQDSNYTSGSAWTKARYNGTKLTSATYNTYTAGDNSYGPTAAVDKYTDYFLYYSNIQEQTTSGSALPGGNVRGVALISINGDVISLTPDNQNIGLVQQMFGVFDTVKTITPTQYLGTDLSSITLTVIVAGGTSGFPVLPLPLDYYPDETNIFLAEYISGTFNDSFFSDSAGYLIPANFNVNYLGKISDIAKQAGFPIN